MNIDNAQRANKNKENKLIQKDKIISNINGSI